MRESIIWIMLLLLPLAIVGGMERRYQALDAELAETVHRYERFLGSVIQDAAEMERELAIHKAEIARNSYRRDMPTQEFLDIMADYLAKDGRCEVVVERVDWSTWDSIYYGGIK